MSPINCRLKKRRHLLDPSSIGQVFVNYCCKRECLLHVTPHFIQQQRRKLLSFNESELNNFIESEKKSAFHKGTYNFKVEDHILCRQGWQLLFDISDHRWKKSDSPSPNGNFGVQRFQPWHSTVLNWMIAYISANGDLSPTNGKTYLPRGDNHNAVFLRCLADHPNIGIKYQTFVNFWKQHFPNVSETHSVGSLGVCSVCLQWKTKLRTKLSDLDKENASFEFNRHKELQSKTREFYNTLRVKARKEPWNLLFLQFDGKQNSRLPHLRPVPKDTSCLLSLKMDVIGVYNISSKNFHLYNFFQHWQHDPNMTLTILYDSLRRSFQNMKHHRPSTLILQIDNCAREGKNKYVLAFAAHLVHFGWFKKVMVGALIQGHTHDSIDQLFSNWSKAESKNNLISPHGLHNFLQRAYQRKSLH